MFINIESKRPFNDANIQRVFQNVEKMALDRFDMTQNLRKNPQLRTEEKRLFKQYYTKSNPSNSVITQKEISVELKLKSSLSQATKLKNQLVSQSSKMQQTKQKFKPQTTRQQQHIQIQENGVYEHNIDPLLLSIQKLQLQTLDKNEAKKKIIDPNSEYILQKKLQQDLEDTYKQKMYGVGGISTEEMRRKYLKAYNPKEDPLFPNSESSYPFNQFRQTIANIFKHACQIKEQRTQLEMFKTSLLYQPIILDTEWPTPLDLILQRYNLHNQHILTSYIVKGRNKQDVKEEQQVVSRILTDIKKLTDNECHSFIEELLDNQMLSYDNKIDKQIIQYYDETHNYTYPSILRPDNYYSCQLWTRKQMTESNEADIKRYMEQLKVCMYKDVFTIFPKLYLYKESRRQIPELIEQYLQHEELRKLAFLENQLLEKIFLQSLNHISQKFQQHGKITLQESLANINKKTKTKSDKERFFDELNACLDTQAESGSYLMKQIKDQLELILYQNTKLVQKNQEHNKVLEKYQSSKLKASKFNNHILKSHNSIELQFNDKLNLGQKMSLVNSNMQAQNYFSNPVANTYFQVLNNHIDKNHWSQLPATQVVQQFQQQYKDEQTSLDEKQLSSRTSQTAQNLQSTVKTKMNTNDLTIMPLQSFSKKINHEFTNMILPVILFCAQYVAIKCAEEIYLFQLNSQVGKMVLQRFYSVLKNLSEPCKIAYQTIFNLL